jgi:hypothetical protein
VCKSKVAHTVGRPQGVQWRTSGGLLSPSRWSQSVACAGMARTWRRCTTLVVARGRCDGCTVSEQILLPHSSTNVQVGERVRASVASCRPLCSSGPAPCSANQPITPRIPSLETNCSLCTVRFTLCHVKREWMFVCVFREALRPDNVSSRQERSQHVRMRGGCTD